MSLSTKKGDRGWTGLLFGHRVRKDSPRVDANGVIDELNSFLGLAKAAIRKRWMRAILHRCQWDLFIVGSEISSLPGELQRLELRIDRDRLGWIEAQIEAIEGRLKPPGCCFLIPGVNLGSALLDVCRCVARRAERRLVPLHRRKAVPNPLVLAYLNRLSDLLWLLARAEEGKHVTFARDRQPRA